MYLPSATDPKICPVGWIGQGLARISDENGRAGRHVLTDIAPQHASLRACIVACRGQGLLGHIHPAHDPGTVPRQIAPRHPQSAEGRWQKAGRQIISAASMIIAVAANCLSWLKAEC